MYAYVNYEDSKRERPFVAKPRMKISKDTLSIQPNNENALAETNTVTRKVSKTKIHTVKRGDNLSDIAEKYDVALSDVKKWNNLKSNKVQAGRKLKIITEQRIAVAEKKQPVRTIAKEPKSESTTEKAVATTEYVVKEGDNLTKIAKENKLYVADIKKWNNLKDSNVKLGDKLKLAAPTEAAANDESVADTKSTTETIFYTVKKGDNLSLIADKNKVTMTDLKEWNDLKSSTVKVGEKLKIEKTVEVVAEVTKTDAKKKNKYTTQKSYIVEKGDSLFIISQKHKTTVAEIKKLNGLKDENIQPGMKLMIKG